MKELDGFTGENQNKLQLIITVYHSFGSNL